MNMNVNNNIPVNSSYGIENSQDVVATDKTSSIKETVELDSIKNTGSSKNELPVLDAPYAKSITKKTYENGLSAAALILSMIAKTLSEQAHENRLAQYEAQMASAEVLEKEAKEIESNATNK